MSSIPTNFSIDMQEHKISCIDVIELSTLPGVRSIVITGVSPSIFRQSAGTKLVIGLSGTVEPGLIQITIDGIVVSGHPSLDLTPTTDGISVTVYTPELENYGSVDIIATQDGIVSDPFSVTVLEFVITPIADSITVKEPSYTRGFAFPFRFLDNGDAEKSIDEQVLKDNMVNSIQIHRHGIPLRADLGSRVHLYPFSQNDEALQSAIVHEAVSAVNKGEPRVIADSNVRTISDIDGNTVTVSIPFFVKSAREWDAVKVDFE